MNLSRSVSLPFLITFFIAIAFAIGFFISMKIFYKPIKTTLITHTLKPKQCQLYDLGEKEKYLDKYTIKKGDSLLLISENQLGDSSRVDEIITLNKEKYPTLSLKNSFLEVGWTLLLPPLPYGTTNGLIQVMHGNLWGYDSQYGWTVYGKEINKGPFLPKDVEKYSFLNLTDGDCITLVYQDIDSRFYNLSSTLKVLDVFKQ